MSRLSIAASVVVVLALGTVVAARRVATHDARQLTARLTGCPADEIDLEMEHFGDTESWRIEGCGIRGTLRCEPTDPGCIVIPDGE